MFNKNIIKNIAQYPSKLIKKANKSVIKLKCGAIKTKIVNDLSIDIIDSLSIDEMICVAKMLSEIFGFKKVRSFNDCCLNNSCKTAVLRKNGSNYLIKLSNNPQTICLNEIAMFSVVGACDYGCVKTFIVSNHEFANELVCFAKSLNITLVNREFVKELLNKSKSCKRIKQKERVLRELILKSDIS